MTEPDFLDQLVKAAPWLVIPTTLFTAAPKILEFWQGLSVVRDARKPLELEKARLENLKLRIEIEALKKENGITIDIDEYLAGHVFPGHPAGVRPPLPPPLFKPPVRNTWGWLASLAVRHPGLTKGIVRSFAVLFVWLGIFAILFYLSLGMFSAYTDPLEEVGYFLLGGFIIFLLPGLLLYKIGTSLKSQSQALPAGVRPPADSVAAAGG